MKKSELTERLNANMTETHERELAFARADRCVCCGEYPDAQAIDCTVNWVHGRGSYEYIYIFVGPLLC